MGHTSDGGGIIIYVRQYIPCKQLNTEAVGNLEGIFLEIRIRGKKVYYLAVIIEKRKTYLNL